MCDFSIFSRQMYWAEHFVSVTSSLSSDVKYSASVTSTLPSDVVWSDLNVLDS